MRKLSDVLKAPLVRLAVRNDHSVTKQNFKLLYETKLIEAEELEFLIKFYELEAA